MSEAPARLEKQMSQLDAEIAFGTHFFGNTRPPTSITKKYIQRRLGVLAAELQATFQHQEDLRGELEGSDPVMVAMDTVVNMEKGAFWRAHAEAVSLGVCTRECTSYKKHLPQQGEGA